MEDLPREALLAHEFLGRIGTLAEAKLDGHLPPVTLRPERLHEAMRYSMFAGGKRLRPALAYAAWETFAGRGESIYLAMSALEMLHTFSLIHDDLPCMDDDDFRRGMPTAHRKFDEATAVLSGDALCIHAFELLARTGKADAVGVIARALGTAGMIGGQMVDIESEGRHVDMITVDYIHDHKTAALIEASLELGALVADAPESELVPLRTYGRALGLAFQVVDDILDIEQTTEQLGKDAGSDIEKGKATYPSIIGLEASKKRAVELYHEGIAALDKLSGRDTQMLRSIAAFIVTRVN